MRRSAKSKQATNQLDILMATSSDAIIRKTTQGIITAWNPGAEDLYGYGAQETIGQPITLIMPAGHQDEFPAIMEQLKRGKVIRRYETQRRHKDGRILMVSLTITPLKDRHGHLVGALSTAHDITREKKELERRDEELRRSGNRFKRLMDANIIGVVIVEGDSIVEANDAFLKLVDYTREELVQKKIKWAQMTPPEYTSVSQHAVEELQTRGECTPFEKEYVRKNGTCVPVLIGAVCFREEPLQWMTLVLDLTAQKELERRKNELITIASHELRTPLTSIKGYAEVLLANGQALSPPQRGYLEIIQRNAQRLVALVNDLLDLSRLEAGRVQMQRRVLDLNELVQEVVQNFQPQLQAKHQQLSVSLLPSVPVVLGDPGRVIQILTNLFSNAHKFTPPDGKIELSMQQDQEMVRIAVQDTGIGMTPEEQQHLFTKFYRAHPFAKEEDGTGMGLAITRALVEMHGGTIEVESAPGQGSTSRFTLLIVRQSPAPPDSSAPSREKGLRILVVEDEPDHTSLLRHLLEQQDNEVLTTYQGSEALSLAEKTQPDLIILDIALPESSGLEVLEQLKHQETTAQIPVLLLTVTDTKEEGVLLGASDVQGKPISQAQLQQRINAIVQERNLPLVLVAATDPVWRAILGQGVQQAGYRLLEAENTSTLLLLVEYQRPHLVLLDEDLLSSEGSDLFRRLLKRLAALHSSLVVLGTVPDAWLAEGPVHTIGKPASVQDVVAVMSQTLTSKERI